LEVEQNLNSTVPRRWKQIWDRSDALSLPGRTDQLDDRISFGISTSRSHRQMSHKRSTVDLLVKGKLLGQATKALGGQAHHFERYTYTTPATCDYCSHVLWGLIKTGTAFVSSACPLIPIIMLVKISVIT
jgi:myotubularin-related protein 5/13